MTQEQRRIVEAAEAWLALGDASEALKELGRLPSSACDLRVMELRYLAFMAGQQWAVAEMVAQVAQDVYPKSAEPVLWWIEARYRQTGDAISARAMLTQAMARFPDDAAVAAQLSEFESRRSNAA